MKKAYISPKTETYRIETVYMIAESIQVNSTNEYGSNPTNSLSREGRGFGDDE